VGRTGPLFPSAPALVIIGAVITRRNFIATIGAVAVTACRKATPEQAGAVASAAKDGRRLERVGIQLYSVRDEMKRDVAATLARLSQIGYREVEFAGYFDKSPAEIKQLLATNGLTAPSTHVPYELLKGDWAKTLDTAVAIGHEYVTIPWMDPKLRGTAAGWKAIAADFNRGAEQAKGRGLKFAYHNHDFEFKPVEGQVPYDILLAETDPALVDFEMDVYWTVNGGADPLAYFRKHPTRFTMLHIKDSAGPPDHKQVDVGAGKIDFAAVLRLDAEQRKAVKHEFVEHDQPPDPFGFAKNSYDYLSRLEY
jgi:sugar phosphate isomerase/epimerase